MGSLETQAAQIPTDWYPVIGFLIVSNIGLVGSAISVVVKHLSQFTLMQITMTALQSDVSKLKSDVDAAHARLRKLESP